MGPKLTPGNWTPKIPLEPPKQKWQAKIRYFVETRQFQMAVLVLILFNALLLGFETMPFVMGDMARNLQIIDAIFIIIFVIELCLRIAAYRMAFFKSGWNVFDLIVIGVSVVAVSSGISALRAFRVMRVLHLVTVMPKIRVVVQSLLDAIPGITSVGVVVVMVTYVFAVVAANLYGDAHPEIFGGVFVSMYTLFQVLTLEGWADIADEVAQTHPSSWIFFVSFVLIGVFTTLNLFVAILVRVVDEESEAAREANQQEHNAAMLAEITHMRNEVSELRVMLNDKNKL